MKKRAGFTLLELLVTIAIIGTISTIAIAVVSIARAQSRDVKRISDLQEVRKALELYYDVNGRYPIFNCGGQSSVYSDDTTPGDGFDCKWERLGDALAPYIANFPKDPSTSSSTPCYWPIDNSGPCGYIYSSEGEGAGGGSPSIPDGSDYDLFVRLETDHGASCRYSQYRMHTAYTAWTVLDIGSNLCNQSNCSGTPNCDMYAVQH